MAGEYGLANVLAQTALSNNPTMISNRRPGLLGLVDMFSKGKDDPTKKQLAENAPTTLNDPDPMSVIGGAFSKMAQMQTNPMQANAHAPDTDTSQLGTFGDVNTTAHTKQMGTPANSDKPGFWDSKGGNILASLLGIVGLGGLGAGIGAISGGGRGALNGMSYGMGFGALQDIGLRKQGMEAPANQNKLQSELLKANSGYIPDDIKTSQYLKNNPELMPTYEQAMRAKKAGETPEETQGMLDMFDNWYSQKYGGGASKTPGASVPSSPSAPTKGVTIPPRTKDNVTTVRW